MGRLKECNDFEKEMASVLEIMESKGFMVESDHPYAYNMQYSGDFNDVREWLKENGYEGNLDTDGHFDSYGGAVYGLFDKDRISREKMHKELIKEGKRQAKWP